METFKHILLVEDDPKDIELILSVFDNYNFVNKIVVARDGVEALDYIYRRGTFSDRPEGNPVVILLDLKMPRLDGIQVLQHLKADEKVQMLPVVILTSSREDVDLEECYKLGVNAYVVKPVHFKEFVEAVKSIGIFWALLNETPPNIVTKL